MMAMAAGPLRFSLTLRRVRWRAWGLWPYWWVFSLSLFALPSPTARAQTPAHPSPPPYQSLRFEEDYRFLRDPAQRTDLWDPLKYLALRDAEAWYVSLGGEARLRYEYFNHSLWGQGPQDHDGYVLQRYMLHADVHLGPRVRIFTQLKSGLEEGRTGGPRPTDKDELDVHQAFVDVTLATQPTVTLRAGRQELAFGSSRLVSVRESPNVRQSFDGLRALLRAGAWKVDGFVTLPVNTKRGMFDDDPDTQRLFWGVYAVHPMPLLPEGHIDLYYLGLNREEARFDQGSAHEVRHTLGLRLWGHPGPWDYNVEVVYQLGTFGEGQIHAWTAASDTGYTLRPVAWQPRLGLKADIISGDRNPRDRDLHTFNPLFPKGAYFGEIALIGPANLIDVHPSLDLHPTPLVTVSADWDVFWRESLHDGIYGNAVNLVRSGQRSRARLIGSQASLQAEWQVERHTTLTAVYSHFIAGSFLRETGPGRDVDYASVWVTYKF
jgi:hypothetical protein